MSTTHGVSDQVPFIVEVRSAGPVRPSTSAGGGQHSAVGDAFSRFFMPMEEVRADAASVFGQAAILAETAIAQAPQGLQLESVSFSLGFDAKGKLAFIAEASITASVEISFKRTGGSES